MNRCTKLDENLREHVGLSRPPLESYWISKW